MSTSSGRLHYVLTHQLPHYVGRLRWLWSDALTEFRSRVIGILVLNALGLLAGAAWVGGLLAYANVLEAGEPMALGLITLRPPAGNSVLPPILALGVLGAISGYLLYQAQWRTALVCVDYQISLARRVTQITSQPQFFGWQSIYEEPPASTAISLSGVTAQLTSLALRRLLKGILPAATFVLAMGFLIYTNAGLTLLLSPLALVYLLPLFLANRSAARMHVKFRALSPVVRGRFVAAFAAMLRIKGPSVENANPVLEQLNSSDYREAAILAYRRRLADTVVQFINTVFTVIALLALFVFYILDDAPRWAELFSYVIALRFALGGLGGVTSVLVGLSRLLPEYERLSNFLERASLLPDINAGSAGQPTRSLRLLPDRAGAKAIPITAGGMLWVISPRPLDHADREAALVLLQDMLRPRYSFAGRFAHWQPGEAADDEWLLTAVDHLDSGDGRQALIEHSATLVLSDHRPGRLLKRRWSEVRSRVCVVLLHDGKRFVDFGDVTWLESQRADIRERIAEWRKVAPHGVDGGDLMDLEGEL